jgi:hypothetical protein
LSAKVAFLNVGCWPIAPLAGSLPSSTRGWFREGKKTIFDDSSKCRRSIRAPGKSRTLTDKSGGQIMPTITTTWMPELVRTSREPSELLAEFMRLRDVHATNTAHALKVELAKVYEIEFRMRNDPAAYAAALKEFKIRVTEATPSFLAIVKMLLRVDAKTAAFYAAALRRAEVAKVECEKIVEFFDQPGGIGGLQRQQKQAKRTGAGEAPGSSDRDDTIPTRSLNDNLVQIAEHQQKIERKAKKVLHQLPTLARFKARKGSRRTALAVVRRSVDGRYRVKFVIPHDQLLLQKAYALIVNGRSI